MCHLTRPALLSLRVRTPPAAPQYAAARLPQGGGHALARRRASGEPTSRCSPSTQLALSVQAPQAPPGTPHARRSLAMNHVFFGHARRPRPSAGAAPPDSRSLLGSAPTASCGDTRSFARCARLALCGARAPDLLWSLAPPAPVPVRSLVLLALLQAPEPTVIQFGLPQARRGGLTGAVGTMNASRLKSSSRARSTRLAV